MAQEAGLTRRLAGLLRARLPELRLGETEDRRSERGRKWGLSTLLGTLVMGLAAGRKSLLQVEALTKNLSVGMRRCLGIDRRVPDTTLRDTLEVVPPDSLRTRLHQQVKAAHRRHALEPTGLPFGMVVLDGKGTALPTWDGHYAEKRTYEKKMGAYGLLRTISCCLVTASAMVCLDAIPLLAGTNEVGFFQEALRQLLAVYGPGLFQMVSYDAGGCSEENADFVVALGLDYLFAIKGNQPGILDVMRRLLGAKKPEETQAKTEDVLGNKDVVTRRVFLVRKEPLVRWSHARTFIRVDSEIRTPEGKLVKQKTSDGEGVVCVTRYFLSSRETADLTAAQWLLLVRRHWGVENNLHHTLDKAFKEDSFPFMPTSPQGSLNVLLLRRIAFNLLALFRGVTQRSDEKRATPWATLFENLYITLVSATAEVIEGLRPRVAATS